MTRCAPWAFVRNDLPAARFEENLLAVSTTEVTETVFRVTSAEGVSITAVFT